MLHIVPTYRPGNGIATATVTFTQVPTTGMSVLVCGVTFTYGTHFFGTTAKECAIGLAAAINGDPNNRLSPVCTNPALPFYAVHYINDRRATVRIITVNDVATFDSIVSITASVGFPAVIESFVSSSLTTTTYSLDGYTTLSNSAYTPLSATDLYCTIFTLYGARSERVLNTGQIWFKFGSALTVAMAVGPGEMLPYKSPEGRRINLKDIYARSETSGDNVGWIIQL